MNVTLFINLNRYENQCYYVGHNNAIFRKITAVRTISITTVDRYLRD